jgi:putative flippase GtrA
MREARIRGAWEKFPRFIRFNLVGLSNTLITFSVFSLLGFTSLGPVYRHWIGYALGMANSFFWNSRYVFTESASDSVAESADGGRSAGAVGSAAGAARSRGFRGGGQVLRFVLVNLAAVALSSLWLALAKDWLGPYPAEALGIALTVFVTYFGSSLFVFRPAARRRP